MQNRSNRVNVVLDDQHAAKLRRLAERANANPGTIARSLLSSAIDDVDPDARTVSEILDGIHDAFERAERGSAEASAGLGVRLEDL